MQKTTPQHLLKAIQDNRQLHPDRVSILLGRLANIYLAAEKISEAEPAAREAIEMEGRFSDGGATTRLYDYQSLLATILEKQGHFSEAMSWLEKAIEGFEKHGDSKDYLEILRERRVYLKKNSWRG